MNFYMRAIKKRKLSHDNEKNKKNREYNNDDSDGNSIDSKEHNLLEFLFSGVNHRGVTMQDNHIFYRTEVTKNSIVELDKMIRKANENYELLKATCKIANIMPKPIYLHISSDGGNLAYGFMGYDSVRNSKIPIYTIIEGTACSAATVISIAGEKRMALENSLILVHQLSSGAYGKANELEDFNQNIKLFMKKLTDLYLNNTKIKSKDLEKLLQKDIFLNAETSIKYGIIDEIYSGDNE